MTTYPFATLLSDMSGNPSVRLLSSIDVEYLDVDLPLKNIQFLFRIGNEHFIATSRNDSSIVLITRGHNCTGIVEHPAGSLIYTLEDFEISNESLRNNLGNDIRMGSEELFSYTKGDIQLISGSDNVLQQMQILGESTVEVFLTNQSIVEPAQLIPRISNYLIAEIQSDDRISDAQIGGVNLISAGDVLNINDLSRTYSIMWSDAATDVLMFDVNIKMYAETEYKVLQYLVAPRSLL